MPPRTSRVMLEVGLCVAALGCAALGALGHWGETIANALLFGAWCAALLLVFVLALRLPLQTRRPGYRAAAGTAVLVAGAIGVTFLANAALFRHDVHFDVTGAARFSPPPALETVAASLPRDVSVTYFFNDGDDDARSAKDLLAIVARHSPHFHVRAIDLDKQPSAARDYGIRAYNTAVVQAEGRRAQVENTTDLNQVAFAVLRVLKQRADTLCVATGHGEPFGDRPAHVHFSHVETLSEHDIPGSGDVLEGPADGFDRLRLAVETVGYTVREITPAMLSSIPADCTVVADIAPRRAYAPGEAAILADYLGRGGRLLLMYDPLFPMAPDLASLLARLGLETDSAVVIDPLNHYRTDEDKVAIPYYPPHTITDRITLTFFPAARPIRVLGSPAGITATPLFASSNESYLKSADLGLEQAVAAGERKPMTLAVALEGRWPTPAADRKPFRLVLVGNSTFASNTYFPYVSNGELAVSMVRWLAADSEMPTVKPENFSLPQITLTHREMQGIFLVIEILLPLSVVLVGALVWWARR